jgi:hypothetical protein
VLRAMLLLVNVVVVLAWGATASSSAVAPQVPPAAPCEHTDAGC